MFTNVDSADAPPRLLRVVVVALIVVLAATILSPTAARAQSAECEETWDRLVSWSEEEPKRGLSTARLEILQSLLHEVETCSQDGTSGIGADPERWRSLVGIYFDAGDVDRVICLMDKESGGNPNARNTSSGAAGLMQVMPGWAGVFGYSPEDLFDPVVNLWIAGQIRDQQGWSAWSPYQRGVCR